MNPFLYKEIRTISYSKALIHNLILLAMTFSTKSVQLTFVVFFFLYTINILTILMDDGLRNIYIFLTGKQINKITHERIGYRLIALILQTTPSVIVALFCFSPVAIPVFIMLAGFVYTNSLLYAAFVYKNGISKIIIGLLQMGILSLYGFSVFFHFQQSVSKILIIICLTVVEYLSADYYLKKVTLEEIIISKGRDT